MLSDIVWDPVGSYYRDGRDAKSSRIQYRDDEGTFVTITDENDVRASQFFRVTTKWSDYVCVLMTLGRPWE